MEILTKNSAKCTVFQSTICNKFSSLMNILKVSLSGPGIKVLGMMKEEQHERKMEQLMEFLQLPLVALLSRAVRNDLHHQFAK
jgi:hypothetical protein